MNLPLRRTEPGFPETLAQFGRRVRPLVDEGLQQAAEMVPEGLGPVAEALGRSLGVNARAGRRWRPLLTVAVCEALGGHTEDALTVAVAVELTHTASLVLDDMPCMDDSPLRRGEPAAHALLGPAGAILLAVGLLARSAELLGRAGREGGELAARWGETFGLKGMSGGQAIDLTLGGKSTGAARRLYRQKTTALVELTTEGGALAAGADRRVREAFRAYGRNLGWAYQLVDDAQDLDEDRRLGRAPGGRSPLRQASRLLDRANGCLNDVPLDPGGRVLLERFSRDVVRIPPLSSVPPVAGGTPC